MRESDFKFFKATKVKVISWETENGKINGSGCVHDLDNLLVVIGLSTH